MKQRTKHYRLNYQITAATLRLLDENGKQIGIFSRFEALKKAQLENKDLVEIAPNANPPVVKLIDFKKFRYLEAKKEREQKKGTKQGEIKGIRLSPFMGEHDFKIRVSQGEEFLRLGHQLKISLPFKGREITHKEFGYEMMNKAIGVLSQVGKIVRAPFMEGKVLTAILAPNKKGEKNGKSQSSAIYPQKV